jgi:hypothetical protein
MCSDLIKKIISEIPEFSEELEFFYAAFDHMAAQRDGVVEMSLGSFPELDNAKSSVVEWEKKFYEYLKDQEMRLK